MKKLFSSRGFVENTLLFLILGITSLSIPIIAKTLPTAQIAQIINNEPTTRIAEETQQGTVKGTITVVPNGVTYSGIGVKYPSPGGSNLIQGFSYNSSNTYSYSVSTKTGSINISASVGDNKAEVIKDSSETCAGTGGNEPFDCKINVKNGETVVQNFTFTLSSATPNPPSGSNAQIYCSGGKIQTDIKFTKSSNAAYHEVRYGVNSSNLSNTIHTTVTSASIPNLTSGTKLSYNTYACSSSGECIADQKGHYDTIINNPCGGSGNAGDSPLNPPIESTDCPNGTATYLEERCGGQKFDAAKATPGNNTYCGKKLSDVYTCSGREIVYDSPADKCSKSPWCPSATSGITTAPTSPVGGGNNSIGQGTLKTIITVIPNGIEYEQVSASWKSPNNTSTDLVQPHNSTNAYTFSGPSKVGTNNLHITVSTGGTEFKALDESYTVTEGNITTKNITLTLPNVTNTQATTAPVQNGSGEICTSENTICGGSNSNSCMKAKDGSSLRCCRFTERFCEALGKCVNGGTPELENCGKPQSTPRPTTQSCYPDNPATNHCYNGHADCCNPSTRGVYAGKSFRCSSPIGTGTSYCIESAQNAQSVSSESECFKNSDCKKSGKNICVLNARQVGLCE